MSKILVSGATGQIGSELVPALREKFGNENVVALVHSKPPTGRLNDGPVEQGDATDAAFVESLIQKYSIDTVYHLVGILSARGEKEPDLAWNVNMGSLKNILDLARRYPIKKIFWPSSIAAFGPSTPRDNTPQTTILQPNTMYGATKVAGELLANYYFTKYNIDVRSLRYPGLISYMTPPGGGTTDYAVAIFYEAIQKGAYTCFLKEDTMLPMMYMPDAIKATIDLMEAPAEQVKTRFSYNITAFSFTPAELTAAIKKHLPNLQVTYAPDSRQQIADSWPRSIDDTGARQDWGWQPSFDLAAMTEDMVTQLQPRLK